MLKKTDKNAERQRRHARVRTKVSGTPTTPRLNVFRSNAHIHAQVIDDVKENLEPAKEKGWNICNAFGYELGKIQRSVEEFLKK